MKIIGIANNRVDIDDNKIGEMVKYLMYREKNKITYDEFKNMIEPIEDIKIYRFCDKLHEVASIILNIPVFDIENAKGRILENYDYKVIKGMRQKGNVKYDFTNPQLSSMTIERFLRRLHFSMLNVHSDVWIKALFSNINTPTAIITDVRTRDQKLKIVENGGIFLSIGRGINHEIMDGEFIVDDFEICGEDDDFILSALEMALIRSYMISHLR